MKYLFPIIVFVLVLILIIFFLCLCTREDQLPDFVSDLKLSQEKDFYEKHQQATLNYLKAVYPTASDTFEKMSAIDLGKFYNSLWFYYNCAAKFNQNILIPGKDGKQVSQKLCWQTLPGCGTTYPDLPYTPQGYIYSFEQWLNNNYTPWFNSQSDLDPSKITASAPGQTFANFYNGPSPVWMFQRAIFRMVYNTDPPFMVSKDIRSPALLPGSIRDFESQWNYPERWWMGRSNGGYMEVTAASEPGMAGSPPLCWVDGWVGSGVFFHVGQTAVFRNKIDAALGLAEQMVQTDEGKSTLKQWYGSENPYECIKNLIYVQTAYPSGNYKNNFAGKVGGITVWDPVNKKPKSQCNISWTSNTNPVSLPFLPRSQNAGDSTTTGDYGFWGTKSVNIQDYYVWCGISEGKEIPDSCLDNARYGMEYSHDRFNNTTNFDEAMFAMGLYLNYDSIQLTQSANGGGFWQYEILVLWGYPDAARSHDYSDFMEIDISQTGGSVDCPPYNQSCSQTMGDNACTAVKYRDSFAVPYVNNVYQHFTLRDPLDVTNEDKVQSCIPGASYPQTDWVYNLTCQNNLSDMFTKLSIVGGPYDQCTGTGTGFKGQPMKDANSAPYG